MRPSTRGGGACGSGCLRLGSGRCAAASDPEDGLAADPASTVAVAWADDFDF